MSSSKDTSDMAIRDRQASMLNVAGSWKSEIMKYSYCNTLVT